VLLVAHVALEMWADARRRDREPIDDVPAARS
jgi:hypothetical protein